MKINKTTVTLTANEIYRLLSLDGNINNMTTVQFKEYKKSLNLLKKLKQQLKEHCAMSIEKEVG